MLQKSEQLLSWLTPADTRVFESTLPSEEKFPVLRAMRNEPISFTLAYRSLLLQEHARVPELPITVAATSKTLPLSVYKICNVPFAAAECEDATPDTPGACPDILCPRSAVPRVVTLNDKNAPFAEIEEEVQLNASTRRTGSVLVTVNEAGEVLAGGTHTVEIKIRSLKTGEVIGAHTVTVELIDAELPPSDLYYTNWMHYDCLADDHGVPLWSDAYFALLGKYLKNATMHGMNTLLTPAFTPALDTPVGTERMNVQLVGVCEENGTYTFDFSLLARFVSVARESGIRFFEHCHLFSQWGAVNAINIYGKKDGSYTRLFGWDTPANDPQYKKFLATYLPAFLAFAREMGIENYLLFHISDEPKEAQLDSYRAALSCVKEIIGEHVIADALSSYAFYQHGLVKLPIVNTAYATDFDGRCDNMMLYYTGGEKLYSLSNRLLSNIPADTRMLGVHLFRYRAKGFLHWGYNYTYGRVSQGHFHPAVDPCFYKNMPGVTYLVYPNGHNGLYPSLREKQLAAAMNDYRALTLLTTLIGYEATLKVCEDALGMPIDIFTLPHTAEAMHALREAVNLAIIENIK